MHQELNRIESLLDMFLKKLTGFNPWAHADVDGVMINFYHILLCHQFKFFDIDRINIYEQIDLDALPGIAYTSKFRVYEDTILDVKLVNDLIKHIKKYVGYRKVNESMRKALTAPDTASPFIIQAWISLLDNRTVINYGYYHL